MHQNLNEIINTVHKAIENIHSIHDLHDFFMNTSETLTNLYIQNPSMFDEKTLKLQSFLHLYVSNLNLYSEQNFLILMNYSLSAIKAILYKHQSLNEISEVIVYKNILQGIIENRNLFN